MCGSMPAGRSPTHTKLGLESFTPRKTYRSPTAKKKNVVNNTRAPYLKNIVKKPRFLQVFQIRVVPVFRGEVNEGEVGYYYDSYHRTISGIPLQ